MENFKLFGMYYAVCKIVILLFTLVFHFKLATHTVTIVYLNFIVYMLICFYHLPMSYYYV